MQSIPASTRHGDSRALRLRLLGFTVLILAAGVGLNAVSGPPRLPSGWPDFGQIRTLLSGSTVPLGPFVLVVVDTAWLMWLWIVGSLALELLVIFAETLAGGARWVASLRGLSDAVTVPLVRRTVAAAFAVQLLTRGVGLASAEPLPPVEVALTVTVSPDSAEPDFRAPASASTYLVRPGDSLWSIASQAYGTGDAYRRLVEANVGRRMLDGQIFTAQGVIRPGWELVVPMPALQIDDVDGQRWYTVQPGDTLSSIAAVLLGDDSRWPELFELNRDSSNPGTDRLLANPNVIWPGLRLRLPDEGAAPADTNQTQAPADVRVPAAEQVAASTPLAVAPSAAGASVDADAELGALAGEPQPALARAPHDFEPIALEPADAASVPDDGTAPAGADYTLPPAPPPGEFPTGPLALGGLGAVAAAGIALGARRLRRLRPLPYEPESDVVVAGGYAEAQLTHEFTRGLHGPGFDPLGAVVAQLQQFLDEYNLHAVELVAARHGRSATTLTLAANMADQRLLLDLASVFGTRLEADAEGWISTDEDVVLRLARLRNTRLLPPADTFVPDAAWLLPLGVLYDRQTFSAAWRSLGHTLIASLPGHGADTILSSLVATLTARRSPEQLRMWLIAPPRALPAPLFDVPHLVETMDPADESGISELVDRLRMEMAFRSAQTTPTDLVVVIPELTSLGEHAARFALLAARADAEPARVRIIGATSCPETSLSSPLMSQFQTRLVMRMQDEETSVALLGSADAAFLGGGGRLLVRLDGREPVELYGYQVTSDHLERLVRVMRSAYPADPPATQAEPPPDGSPEGALNSLETADAPADLAAHAWTEPSVPAADAPPEPESIIAGDTGAPPGDTIRVAPEPVSTSQPHTTAPAVSAPAIEVICFGGPRVLCAGQQVWPRLGGGEIKPWELLLYLACQPAEGVSGEDALEALWPEDEDTDNPAHRFRQLRYRLRKALSSVPGAPPTDGICFDRRRLRLDPGVVHSDAQEFLALVKTARVTPGVAAIPLFERARALFMGDLLEGPDARRYTWVDERDDSGVTLREHFRRLFQHASTRLAELYTSCGETDAAVELYRELTDIDAGDERLWLALFRLHAERSDRVALLGEERRMRETLRELAGDLEESDGLQLAEPSRETVQEFQRLLASVRAPDREPAAV